MAYSATGSTGPAAGTWNNVVWSPSLSLFVGSGGSSTTRIATSSDGTSWTGRTTPNATFGFVAWDETAGLFVSSGSGSVIITSPDGITWTTRTNPKGTSSYQGAAYSSSLTLWAMVDGDAATSTNRVATSPDGITWTIRTASDVQWTCVAWSPSAAIFVALGTDSAISSTDGITWTDRTISTGAWRRVVWSSTLGKFVAIGFNGSSETIMSTSTDGITWTAATTISTAVGFVNLAIDDSSPILLALGYNGSEYATLTSDDASTWVDEPTSGDALGVWTSGYNGAYSPTLDKFLFAGTSTFDFVLLTLAGSDDTFWYKSDVPGLETGVDATIVSGASARPKGPRGLITTTPFNTANPLYGYPGHAIAFNNRMIYANGDYTIGTDLPPIRVWNGTSDYQLAVVPVDAAGNTPKCITTIVNADGNVYLGTWDTGTSSSDVAGRILKLDPNSGQLTNVGNVNTLTGYIPWALWFHNGELWAGLHRSDTSAGRIYRIKPGEQTTWTQDRDLSSDSVGPCTVINSFQGKMYFGSAAASGTFAKFGSRDTTGTYSLLYTGTGGTAQNFNGFYAATVFGDNLYFSYWNPDTTEISLIKKYDGTTVTTAYDVTGVADVPIIALFVHDGVLYAVGSRKAGTTYTSVLLTTPDGTTWTDRTGDIVLGSFTSRGVTNAFASIAY